MIYAHDDFQRVAVVTTDKATPEYGEVYKNGDKYEVWDGTDYKLIGTPSHGYINETNHFNYIPDMEINDFFHYDIDRAATIQAPVNFKNGDRGTIVLNQGNINHFDILWNSIYVFPSGKPDFEENVVQAFIFDYKVVLDKILIEYTTSIAKIPPFIMTWSDTETAASGGVKGYFPAGQELEYSNDGGATFTTLTGNGFSWGDSIALTAGTGPYELKESLNNAGTLEKIGFGIWNLTDSIIGSVNITGGALLDTKYMFCYQKQITSVTIENLDKVTTAEEMFSYNGSLVSVFLPDMPQLTNATGMFRNDTRLTAIDTTIFKYVTNATLMFDYCIGLTTIDTTNFKSLITIDGMFNDCKNLANISTETFGEVTSAINAFYNCTTFTVMDVSNFSKVTDGTYMFANCSNLVDAGSTPGPHFESLILARNFMSGCTAVTTINTTTLNNVTDANCMFQDCTGLTSMDTTAFTNVITADGTFKGCTGLTTIDTSVFTSATTTANMFDGCTNLITITAPTFTSVTYIAEMFINCSSLIAIDTSSFTLITGEAHNLFKGCSSLTTIDTSMITNPESSLGMFDGCTNVTSIQFGGIPGIGYMPDLFRNCSSLICISKLNTTDASTKTNMFTGCGALVQPDAAAVTDLTDGDGADWVHPTTCP